MYLVQSCDNLRPIRIWDGLDIVQKDLNRPYDLAHSFPSRGYDVVYFLSADDMFKNVSGLLSVGRENRMLYWGALMLGRPQLFLLYLMERTNHAYMVMGGVIVLLLDYAV